jgi:hypothetical protein
MRAYWNNVHEHDSLIRICCFRCGIGSPTTIQWSNRHSCFRMATPSLVQAPRRVPHACPLLRTRCNSARSCGRGSGWGGITFCEAVEVALRSEAPSSQARASRPPKSTNNFDIYFCCRTSWNSYFLVSRQSRQELGLFFFHLGSLRAHS